MTGVRMSGLARLFIYADLEKRVWSDHPLIAIRRLVNEALVALEHEFAAATVSATSGAYEPQPRWRCVSG